MKKMSKKMMAEMPMGKGMPFGKEKGKEMPKCKMPMKKKK
jgi:hypothetical protein